MYKPRCKAAISVPKFGSAQVAAEIVPAIIEARWTKNHYLIADELILTIGWKEGGVDPRMLKSATCRFWMWDAESEDFKPDDTPERFTGICKKATRRLHESGWVVDLTFYDYTTLFLMTKPLATTGIPEWSDTLESAWQRICDNTGWQDPDSDKQKIISSVGVLRKNLVFPFNAGDEMKTRTLGELTNNRFHALSKPQPKTGASSWDVWQWCVSSLGLLSYIEKDICWITNAEDYYSEANAAFAVYGGNIHSLEETCDNEIASKGILLKSFDTLSGKVLESFWPLPGDPRLKIRRGAVGKKSEGGATVTANEVSADYEEFARYDITDQAALDRACREAFEERSRQELEGSFKTSEMFLASESNPAIDILSLRAGDAIKVVMEPEINHDTLKSQPGLDARVRYLVDHCDYDADVARLVASNIDYDVLSNPTFHIKCLEVTLTSDSFEVEIKFHNLILTNS